MHATRMPGFSADASRYRSIGYRRPGEKFAGLGPKADIVPAMRCKWAGGGDWYCCGSDDLHCCGNVRVGYIVCGGKALQ